MQDTIQTELDRIETQYAVTCLLACESGSRAWGFASLDSDYDVRFVYFHPLDWYLNIFERRDVIEQPISGLLDISGWDLRKALRLLWNNNPALLEWLSSPIVYRRHAKLDLLRRLAEKSFIAKSSCHHYLALARRYQNKIAGPEAISAKTYLYALRPLLCCQWIVRERAQAPMRFAELLDAFLPHGDLRALIDQLLAQKARSRERDTIERIAPLDAYIAELSDALASQIPANTVKRRRDDFERVFRAILAGEN